MTIRQKTLIAVGAAFAVLIIVLFIVSRLILLGGFDQLEMQQVERNVQRVVNALDTRLNTMRRSNIDYAHWTDTYEFVSGENDAYIEANLMPETLLNLNIDMMLFVNTDGEIVHEVAFDSEGEPAIVPTGLKALLESGSSILQADVAQPEGTGSIVNLGEVQLLVTSVPVLTSNMEGPAAGTLIWAQYIDDAAIEALATTTQLDVSVVDTDSVAVNGLNAETPILVRPLNEATVAGFTIINDLFGRTALMFRIEMPRDVYAQGQHSLLYLLAALLITGLVLAGVVAVLLERIVLSRLAKLTAIVSNIGSSGNLTQSIPVDGKDELGKLAEVMNAMLAMIKVSQQALRSANEGLEHRVEERTAALSEEIKERERAQQELALARDRALDALRLRTQILANVSHDSRTPLNAILGYAQILQDEVYGDLNEQQQNALARIANNADQLLSFINNLLDEAQIEAGKLTLKYAPFRPAELAEALDTAFSEQARAKGIALSIEVDGDLPPMLNGDIGRLIQIMSNLTNNAIKFTDQGEVQVRVFRADNEHWAGCVSDTGTGIPKEAQPFIFDAFWQVDGSETRAHNSGVGLGLSIVKQLTALMGGQIMLDSEPGRGTTFTVRLPIVQVEEAQTA